MGFAMRIANIMIVRTNTVFLTHYDFSVQVVVCRIMIHLIFHSFLHMHYHFAVVLSLLHYLHLP
jgi:hypothetical protein